MRLPRSLRSGIVLTVFVFLMPASSSVQAFTRSGSAHRPQQKGSHAHAVDLKWEPSASRVVGYNVYRSEMAAGPFMKLNSTPVRATRYSDGTVQAGHSYFYKVAAVDNRGQESAYSNQIKATVPSP